MRLSTSYFLLHGRQCCGFSLGDRSGPLHTRPEEELLLWTSKIRILRGAFWRTNRSYRFHCPHARSGTEISGPATASIHETPHIGRWRTGLHRYGRIRRALYPAGGAPERRSAPQLGLLSKSRRVTRLLARRRALHCSGAAELRVRG